MPNNFGALSGNPQNKRAAQFLENVKDLRAPTKNDIGGSARLATEVSFPGIGPALAGALDKIFPNKGGQTVSPKIEMQGNTLGTQLQQLFPNG